MHRLADDDPAARRLRLALAARGVGQRPQQGGLAGAVDADQADPVAGAELPGDVLQQHLGPGLRRVTSSRSKTVLPSRE